MCALLGLWFLFGIVIGLYFPGRLFLRTSIQVQSPFHRITLFVGFGMVLWILQAYLFGLLHIRWMSYVYLATSTIISMFTYASVPKAKWKKSLRKLAKYWWVVVVFIAGVVIQTVQSIPSGFIFRDGWHTFIADDALWHLGLTGELIRHMPPNEPGTAGLLLTNYHYLANLFIADFSRVFGLPLLTVQFFFICVFLSMMLGLLLFVLGRMAGLSMVGAALVMYLQYFASDTIYAIPLITRHVVDFSVHPLEDGTMFLENPPRAFASVITVVGIILLVQTVRSKRVLLSVLTGITFGVVIGCKIHSGIMVLIGLFAIGLYALFKRNWVLLVAPILALILSVAIYLPTNSGAGGPVFAPFEMAHMFVVQPNLSLSFLELRRLIYLQHNNYIRVLEMNLIMLGIFYISQFGLRTIGWFGWRIARKSLGTEVAIFLFASLVGTTLFGTLFIQPITYADIFNSYLAASVILSLLNALILERLIRAQSKVIAVVILLIIGAMTIPRIFYRMQQFSKELQNSAAIISNSEIHALDFVREKVKSDTVVYVFNKAQIDGYESYVSALTSHDTFLAGQNYLGRHGVDYSGKQRLADIIATSFDPALVNNILKSNRIGILYAYKPFALPAGLKGIGVRKIFENSSNIVYSYP